MLDRLLRELLLLDETDFRCRVFRSEAFPGDFFRSSDADELDRLCDLRAFLSTDLEEYDTNEFAPRDTELRSHSNPTLILND